LPRFKLCGVIVEGAISERLPLKGVMSIDVHIARRFKLLAEELLSPSPVLSPADLGVASDLNAASLTVGQARKVAKRRPSAFRPSDPRSLLNPHEAANRLGVSVDTLDGIVRDGALAFVNVGRGEKRPRRMFDEHDVDAFIETRKQRCTSTKTASRNSSKRKSGSRGDNIVALHDARIADRRKRLLGG
jgi:excisionase family DNA binding protein